MNFVNFGGVSKETLERIVNNAIAIKKNQQAFRKIFDGFCMYMLFEKTSTRTSLSFDRAMVEMGGTVFSQKFEDSNFCIGEIQDEIRYVTKNVDVVMARMKKNSDINLMAQYSYVPVINGCCNKYHPCQAMADMMTIKERFGNYNKKLLYIGVWNNVFNSLVESFPKLGGKLYGLTPVINESTYDENVVNVANSTGNYTTIDPQISQKDLKELIAEMDVIYSDTWVDMEYFNNPDFTSKKNERINIMSQFQINEHLLCGSKAIVMHDMPMHPGFEIDRATIEKHIETILQQGENRRHAQKGVLLETNAIAMNRFNEKIISIQE
jgi:ornithine carbamoyltransferase